MQAWRTVERCYLCHAVEPYCEWCEKTGMLVAYTYVNPPETKEDIKKFLDTRNEKRRIINEEFIEDVQKYVEECSDSSVR